MKFGLPLTLFLVLSMALTVQASVGGDLRGEVDVQISVSGWADVRTYGDTINLNITDPTEPAETPESERARWAVHANTPVSITFESLGFDTTAQWGLHENFRPDKYFTYKVMSQGENINDFKPKRVDSNAEGIDTSFTRNTDWDRHLYYSKAGWMWVQYSPDTNPEPDHSGWMHDYWDGWEALRAETYQDTIAITVSEILD